MVQSRRRRYVSVPVYTRTTEGKRRRYRVIGYMLISKGYAKPTSKV